MNIVITIVCLADALLSVAASAQTVAAANTPPPPADTVVVKIVPATTSPPSEAERYKTESVCRTTTVTGSLVAKRKTCLTRKQWEYVDQAHRDEARKMMMDDMGKPPGN